MNKQTFKAWIGLMLIIALIQFILIVRLLTPEKYEDRQCIPLYDETGYECCGPF